MYVDLSEVEVGTTGNVAVITRDWGGAWTPGTPGAPGFKMYLNYSEDISDKITSIVVNDDSTVTITFNTTGLTYYGAYSDYILFEDQADFDFTTEVYLLENSGPPPAPLVLAPPVNIGLIRSVDRSASLSRGMVMCLYGRRNLMGAMPTLAGNAALVTDGSTGLALALDGTGDYLTLPADLRHTGMAQLTLAAWVYKGTKDIKPFGRWGGGAANSYLFRETSGVLQGYVNNAGGNFSFGGLTGWHLYAMTYDGALLRLYRDGQLDGTTQTPGTGAIYSGAATLYMGAEYDGSDGQDGRYGPAFMWNRALSVQDNTQLFAPATRWSMLAQPRRIHAMAGSSPPPSTIYERRYPNRFRSGSRSAIAC